MKKKLLIIGGGFAGFWSAISAVRQSREIQKRGEVEIILVDPDNNVTIRPALNELSLEGLSFAMDRYLKPLGVHQILGKAEKISPEKNEVIVYTTNGVIILSYDYLILATGVSLNAPDLPGFQHTFNVDSFASAQRLENHLVELAEKEFHEEGASTIIVVGSEFTGLETVTGIERNARTIQAYYSGKSAQFKIILLESESRVASGFSEECRQYIQEVLASKNIEVRLNCALTIIGPASVLLNNGTRISTRTVIWTKGLAASFLTKFLKGPKDDLNRLSVDPFLKVPAYNNVIAAGSIAHSSGDKAIASLMDCQYAQFEGRWAGHNAMNDLFGVPLKKYVEPGYIACPDLGEPLAAYENEQDKAIKKIRYRQRAAERHLNRTTIFPWQDIEATIKASYPEFPFLNNQSYTA